ncbi:hypothetical protein Btru_014990 [Bulinus truncatus]|nr:hypothetical protein Btru_014990 [Bulinus truncatus]
MQVQQGVLNTFPKNVTVFCLVDSSISLLIDEWLLAKSKKSWQVSVSRKLPIMYLIDSIIKNLSTTDYPQLFAQCIVQIFCGVFEEVDEKTRTSLYKLRQTWVEIIPNKQLYILDRKVQLIDPAWPITAKPPEHGNIHVNPKFLKPNKEKERSPQFSPVQPEPSFTDDSYKDELLYTKEKEIEALRLKLELAETKAKLDAQKKQLEETTNLRHKKVIDREPPSVIKLPPASSSPLINSQVANRDPRLNRAPAVNRDPRLKKQMEREEQERIEFEKQMSKADVPSPGLPLDAVKTSEVVSGARKTSQSNDSENNSTSPRMDLATLLTSFTNAAAKVAAEQSKKKSPQPSVVPKQIETCQPKKVDSKSKSSIKESSKSPSKEKKVESHNNLEPDSSSRNRFKNSEVKDKDNYKDMKGSPAKSRERIDSREKNKKEVKERVESDNDKRDGRERRESSEKSDSKDRDRRDSKDRERRDSKDRVRRDSKDRVRRDSKDRRDKDKSESKEPERPREKKTESDSNRHSPRSNYGRSQDKRRYFREERPSRERTREKPRTSDPVIHSSDGKTDQFGRMLRMPKSGSTSRDRSPLDRSNTSSPKIGDSEEKIAIQSDSLPDRSPLLTDEPEVKADLKPVLSEDKPMGGDKKEIIEGDDLTQQNMDIEEITDQNKEDIDIIQDVDMRIGQAVPEKKVDTSEEKDDKEDSKELSNDAGDPPSPTGSLKRLNSELEEAKSDVRPYKIPKLDPSKKAGSKNESHEDISKLFGEEDVDYRHQMLPKSVLVPPPMPADSLLSPPASNLKSPAQRRWSQFKESHPDDFAQDIERKRLRDAQMQSIALENQDVDLRHMTPSRMRTLPLPLSDPSINIPKDLSAENQEQILLKAEQELKEGRISHGDHQEIVRQLGQVYDIQKKRQNMGDRPARSLDLRDPRLRGIRESRGYPDDMDQRGPYREDVDVHKKPLVPSLPLSGDMPDESAGNSPRYRDRRDNFSAGYEAGLNEDYDARRVTRSRHERRGGADYNRRRGPAVDFDGRSPRDYDMENSLSPRDFEDHVHGRLNNFDGRPHRENEKYDKRPQDYDVRRPPIEDEDRTRNYRDIRPYGEYNDRPLNSRGPPMRDHRQDELRERRRNTPPMEGTYQGLSDEPRPYGVADDGPGPRPYGMSEMGPGPRPFGPPRHMLPQDIRGPRPNFTPMRPQGPRSLCPDGPRSMGPMPASSNLINQNSRISDPMEDPRWSAMRGLLDNDGTEELVINGKPFELRMGTSRKLHINGKIMDVAVDLKERGIRIDNQLVYKLGEPIKEVPAGGKSVRLYYHGLPKPIWLDGQQHEMRMDAPPRNVMVDGVRRGFQIDGRDMMILVDRLEKGPYGGPPRKIIIAGVDHDIAFQAPPRRILIDNKSCELKLDSKIPYIIINGKPHGIRFDGEPRTVFINEQPFTIPVDRAEKIRIGPRPTYIAFGGPAHEIIIDGKWFEVKFDNIPKDIHLGNRHFSIRIPGPLPRVKILDELPPNFDESRLMSSNQMLVPQPGQPRMALSDLNEPVSGAQPDQFIPNPATLINPAPMVPSDGTVESVPANNQTAEGIMRPVGPDIRFGQPNVPNMVPPAQSIMAQPGQAQMLPQQNQIMHGQIPNGLLGLRQNLMGFGMNQPRPPVNLIAQGLFNQVASSMINSQFGGMTGIPDFAAGLRALSQMTGHVQPAAPSQMPPQMAPQMQPQMAPQMQPQMAPQMQPQMAPQMQPQMAPQMQPQMAPQMQPQMAPQMQPQMAPQMQPQMAPQMQPQMAPQMLPQPQPVQKDEDHGAAMVTGMQGTAFGSQQFGKPVAPSLQVTNTVAQSATPGLTGNTTVSEASPSTSSVQPPIDIHSLLNNLLKVGLIKEPPKTETVSTTVSETVVTTSKVTNVPLLDKKQTFMPDLTDFNIEKLRKLHTCVIDQLHDGIQCHTCAARFTINDHEKYRAHLDWHFRQNKMEQEMVKVAKNRKWFYSIPDWVQYEELEDTEDKSRSEIFEQMRPNEEKPATAATSSISFQALEGKDVIKNPVATGVEGEDVCATCGDPFDQMWNEETEEWILKNTIKVDGKTYHPVCYEDAQETPTPVFAPSKNPLEVQLASQEDVNSEVLDKSATDLIVNVKLEPQEIKQEPIESQGEVLPLVKQEIKSEIQEQSADKSVNEHVTNSVDDINMEQATVIDAMEQATVMDAMEQDTASDALDSKSVVESVPIEIIAQAPTMLSNITSTVLREVIPVSHDEPMSPWEMDSNPTPELSRTPTPEPSPSFTPAPSVSSESIHSLIPNVEETMSSEDPIPPLLLQSSMAIKPEIPVLPVSSQQKVEQLVSRIDDRGL